MDMFKKPNRLKPGDTVATLSPSWGGPSIFPHIYEAGVNTLEKILGLKVKEYPTAKMGAERLYQNPKIRAKDINDAFADESVKAIITTIGGEDSIRVLPWLDKDIIKSNPKILMGFSDSTTLLASINQLGLVTFHGPSVMAGLAQAKNLPARFIEDLKTILFEDASDFIYRPYEQFHEGYPDWSNKSRTGELNSAQATDGWHWISGKGQVEGILWGGSFEVLEFMKATQFWPNPNFWDDKILFLETSEGKPSPVQVKYFLRNYGAQGILGRIKALLIGRARDYSQEEKEELEKMIKQIMEEFNADNLSVVSNMDFGHTDPQIPIPLGVRAHLDVDSKKLSLLESPTLA